MEGVANAFQNGEIFKDMLDFDGSTIAQISFILFLVLLTGLFSGLNLGLMNLDPLSLEIVIGSGTATQSKHAKRIYPIRKRGNLLLCTILLGNVSVNALLSILMASFTSGTVGFLCSTIIIVVFGEIIPQALCSRHGLAIGYYTVWIVWIFLIVLLPVSYPISKVLDLSLGRELGTIYSRHELKKLLDIHSTYSDITKEETSILVGALDFSSKKVEEVMTPIDDVYMIEINEELNPSSLQKLLEVGYSRIPVYQEHRQNIIGLIFVRDLAIINPHDHVVVKDILPVIGRNCPRVYEDTKLSEMLEEFKKGHSHIAIVRSIVNSSQAGVQIGDAPLSYVSFVNVGVITLEDILTDIIRDDINDETDLYLDSKTVDFLTGPPESPSNNENPIALRNQSNTNLNTKNSPIRDEIIIVDEDSY